MYCIFEDGAHRRCWAPVRGLILLPTPTDLSNASYNLLFQFGKFFQVEDLRKLEDPEHDI